MQANQSGVIWTVVICSALLLVAGIIGFNGVSNEPVNVPTAAEIAALVTIPAAPIAPETDTETLDRVCELTNGCEYWEPENFWSTMSILNNLKDEEAAEDFADAFSDLIGYDDDEYQFVTPTLIMAEDIDSWNDLDQFYNDEYQIRAYSDDDKKDGNWEIKVFMKVKYHDIDSDVDDNEISYVVVTSILDEGEYDKLSIEEVSRSFEFD